MVSDDQYTYTLPFATRDLRGRHHYSLELMVGESEQERKDMGWLRLVGSFKLWVSFAKESCKRDDILQKRL